MVAIAIIIAISLLIIFGLLATLHNRMIEHSDHLIEKINSVTGNYLSVCEKCTQSIAENAEFQKELCKIMEANFEVLRTLVSSDDESSLNLN